MTRAEVLRALVTPAAPPNRFYGVVVGVVTNNQDPDDMHRVKVRFPWLSKDTERVESNWARVAAPMTGGGRGQYFLPEVDDEVLVAFEHGQIDHPFVIGSLWNGQDTAPESNADGQNNHRTIKSRSGHVLRFNDKAGGETIEIIDRTGSNKIIIDSAANTITIEAQSDITIKSATGKLTMQAIGIEMKSQLGVSVEAATSMDLKANAVVTVKGAMIRLN
jgi:phage baseplate assembly protein V